jgi:uncharacterized membrane protein
MHKGRFEAFTDAVIAIILTIMVLDLRPPHEANWTALLALAPTFAAYVLSYVHLGIYWNNHHHMLQSVQKVNGPVLWANLAMLLWLSFTPFATAWMGQSNFASTPVMAYGIVLFLTAIAYYILCLTLVAANGKDSPIAKALGRDLKGKISPCLYLAAIFIAPFQPLVSCALYATVSLIWLIPDRRFERVHLDS